MDALFDKVKVNPEALPSEELGQEGTCSDERSSWGHW